jgi:hypothetical protein
MGTHPNLTIHLFIYLFICVLFTYCINSSDYTVLRNLTIINILVTIIRTKL